MLFSGKNVTNQLRRMVQITHLKFLDGRGTKPQSLGIDLILLDLPVTNIRHMGRRSDRTFVKTIPGVEDQSPDGSQSSVGLGNRPNEGIVIDPHDLTPGAGRVGQWPEQVEQGRKTKRLPHRNGVHGRRMVVNGKAECDPCLGHATLLNFTARIDIHTELVEDFRGPTAGA